LKIVTAAEDAFISLLFCQSWGTVFNTHTDGDAYAYTGSAHVNTNPTIPRTWTVRAQPENITSPLKKLFSESKKTPGRGRAFGTKLANRTRRRFYFFGWAV